MLVLGLASYSFHEVVNFFNLPFLLFVNSLAFATEALNGIHFVIFSRLVTIMTWFDYLIWLLASPKLTLISERKPRFLLCSRVNLDLLLNNIGESLSLKLLCYLLNINLLPFGPLIFQT